MAMSRSITCSPPTSARCDLKPAADARPKITHCTLITDDLVRRIKAIGVVPALFTSYAYYNPDKFHFYGEELMKRCMAYRTLLDAGVPAAAGSDFDPGPFSPFMGIQGMVTRTGWNGEVWGANQRITVDEALRVNTLNWRLCDARGIDQGIDHARQARRLRHAGRGSAHGGSRRRSRTSRSCAPWSAVKPSSPRIETRRRSTQRKCCGS